MTDDRRGAADSASDRLGFVKELATGVGIVAFILWLTFFGTAGFVEIATLVVAVAMLIWFATVEPARLVGGPQAAPDSMLFLLAGMTSAIVLTATLIFASATMFLVAMLTVSAAIVGFVRALGHRYRQKPETEDGIL